MKTMLSIWLLLALTLHAGTTATSNTITWTWTEDRTQGTYANGDPWVVGPITLQTITRPSNTNGRDGSQINVSGGWPQGFTDNMQNLTYSAELDITNTTGGGDNGLPYTVAAGNTVISSISRTNFANGLNDKVTLDYGAVLTVVNTPPAAGSFRPFYGPNSKTPTHNISELDYNKLANVALPSGATAPSIASLEAAFDNVMIATDGATEKGINYPVAANNFVVFDGSYGQTLAPYTSNAALVLNMSHTNAEKETLLIRAVQYGLDCYEFVKLEMTAPDNFGFPEGYLQNGGQGHGRKILAMLAAHVLGDTTMFNYLAATDGLAENHGYFVVTQADVDQARAETNPGVEGYQVAYNSGHIGMADWAPGYGANSYYRRDASSHWGRKYRNSSYGQLGSVVAAHLMGIKDTYGGQPMVRYFEERVIVIEHDTDQLSSFQVAMFDEYMDEPPPEGGDSNTITAGTLNVGTLTIGN